MLDSGESLLSLINEILDLSKIEAGHMDLEFEPVPLTSLVEDTRRMFDPVFEQKGLDFDIRLADSCPEEIISDRKRISQVLKNLISNASKFTEEGGVTVTFEAGECRGGPGMVFAVEDTGCGIPEKKQHLIFEAFRQAEGGTARKYGGTGLGLSISRELVRILGGEIGLESEEGRGSVFRVSLPLQPADEQVAGTAQRGDEKGSFSTQVAGRDPVPDGEGVLPAFGSVPDDREELEEEARPILIIEDDSSFASVLVEQCHDKGLKALVASSGEEGIQLAKTRNPGAVILDLRLPGMNGWTVLNQLKESVETRHIPVHIMSAEDPPQKALTSGAIGFLRKPVQKEKLDEAFERIEDMYERGMKDLLVVEDDDTLRKAVLELIGNGDVHGEGVGTGKQALEILQNKRYDCLILDLNLPDMSGFDLLEAAGRDKTITLPPVIVYTGRELTREEEGRLNAYSESIIVKGVRSRERLFDEASLFLHRMVKKMPEFQREMIVSLHESERMFEGKRVLIVDDDMRNLFALSSSLSAKGMRTLKAADGIKALDMLEQHPDVDLVLMDIMMPEMDGYEAMRTLRSDSRFEGLPVIALTAKAMQDDRRKCLEAGANDYLSKPIDLDRLFSMMRVWLYR
jgi:CheY-like chemotaxis protein